MKMKWRKYEIMTKNNNKVSFKIELIVNFKDAFEKITLQNFYIFLLWQNFCSQTDSWGMGSWLS